MTEETWPRWWKNGDHPHDGDPSREGRIVRRFNDPDVPPDTVCDECGHTMHEHGWIDEVPDAVVCPGDYIVTRHVPVKTPPKRTFTSARVNQVFSMESVKRVFAMPKALADYWMWGKGAARIRWGTDGAMTRCARLIRKEAGGSIRPGQEWPICQNLRTRRRRGR